MVWFAVCYMCCIYLDWKLNPVSATKVYESTKLYSRVQKSIENWSVSSKMALGELGMSLP